MKETFVPKLLRFRLHPCRARKFCALWRKLLTKGERDREAPQGWDLFLRLLFIQNQQQTLTESWHCSLSVCLRLCHVTLCCSFLNRCLLKTLSSVCEGLKWLEVRPVLELKFDFSLSSHWSQGWECISQYFTITAAANSLQCWLICWLFSQQINSSFYYLYSICKHTGQNKATNPHTGKTRSFKCLASLIENWPKLLIYNQATTD